jgi:mono/diheme cytochrome c family protein
VIFFHLSTRRAARILGFLAFFGFASLPLCKPCSGAEALSNELAQGRIFFMQYCASCHGATGDGNGPASRALKDQPADLRKLGERYGMPLPAARIARFIDGRSEIAAHGSRTMPVWGERFGEIYEAKGSTGGELKDRIAKIIFFLNSIQEHPASPPPAGVH